MKKQILLSVILLTGIFFKARMVNAQPNLDNHIPPTHTITVNNMPPIIGANVISTVSKPDFTGSKKRTVLWCEYGDGGFTTDSISKHACRPSKNYDPLILTSTIYDTTKDGIARFVKFSYTSGARKIPSSDNDVLLTTQSSFLALTPSITSIVPGDTMVFAITYRIPEENFSKGPDGKAIAPVYKLVLLYNNKNVFDELDSNKPITIAGVSYQSVRTPHGGSVSFPANSSTTNSLPVIFSAIPDAATYNSYIIFDLPQDDPIDFTEKNVFITLRPKDSILLGSASSIKAVLIKIENGQNISKGEALLANMPVARAHDPNYINQQDRCITTAKNNTTLSYHVHFQNDGVGDADSVIVKVALPDKIKFSDLIFLNAAAAGINNIPLIPADDPNSDSVIFTFTFNNHNPLRGTQNNPNAFSNPNTMGDIFFTVKTNSNLADTIFSRAAIYFYSAGQTFPEEAVFTQPAMSYFTKCCNCPPSHKPGCKNFLGLCWWWWILIFIVILFILYILFRRRKKQYNRQGYN